MQAGSSACRSQPDPPASQDLRLAQPSHAEAGVHELAASQRPPPGTLFPYALRPRRPCLGQDHQVDKA